MMRVIGQMETSNNIEESKSKAKKQKALSITPELWDSINYN